ncbi:MAG: pilus assembly protein TadG-related protein [Gaiellaceae bacterium]|jgi:Flp pilus assembly protein TadG
MLLRIRLRRRSREEGQTVVLAVIAMVALLALAAFAIDVGYVYYAHRSLQASADAAALAGAQKLPDASAATATAKQFGTGATGKNQLRNIGDVTESITTKCLSSLPGCNPVNAVVAQETAQVPTFFARVLGISSMTVTAKATACSYCGVKPLDIMLVVDRTGSMCMDHWGNNDPACTDMNNEKTALNEFLGFLEPARQRVGLVVFPPASSLSQKCSSPSDSNYNSTSSPYVLVPLSNDFATKAGVLNTSSSLVSTINCLKAAGDTSYATAIEKAQAELVAHGRAGVDRVIIFFSDGAANIGPTYYSSTSPYRKQPCHQGVSSAGTVKSSGTVIYSIGYDLDAQDGGANVCRYNGFTGPLETPSISAYSALQQIASSLTHFYVQPSAGDLSNVYLEIAADFSRGASGLIDNSTS